MPQPTDNALADDHSSPLRGEYEAGIAIRAQDSYFRAVRLLTWIPILALLLLLGLTWIAFRSERPFAFEFDEPPAADTLADPLITGVAAGEESIHGLLLTQSGRPVREALVKTQQRDRLRWTYTDSDGRFHIAGVEPGSHTLTVVARGHLPMVFQALAGEAPVELRLSAPVPAPPAVPASVRSDLVVSLRSLADEEDPTRFELHLEPLDDDIRAGPTFPRTGRFSADGTCVVPELTRGQYRARIIPAWASGGTWPDLLTDLDGPGQTIDHPSDGSPELELRAGEIRGRITDVKPQASQGVEFVSGALILVRPAPAGSGAEPDGRLWPPAQSNEQGSFLVRDLAPGRYVVTVHIGDRRLDREVTVYPAATTTLDL